MRGRMTALLPLLAAGALALAGCGGQDGAAADGASPGGGVSDGETPGGPPSGVPSEEASAPEEPEEPGTTPPAADPAAFDRRAAEVVDAWPDPPAEADGHGKGLWPVEGVAGTDAQDTELTVLVTHGACDGGWGSWLHETDTLVVVGGWSVPRATDAAGECHHALVVDEVQVRLDAPLGDRTVLDAANGQDPRAADYRPW